MDTAKNPGYAYIIHTCICMLLTPVNGRTIKTITKYGMNYDYDGFRVIIIFKSIVSIK